MDRNFVKAIEAKLVLDYTVIEAILPSGTE
jgi:hypothetical protein